MYLHWPALRSTLKEGLFRPPLRLRRIGLTLGIAAAFAAIRLLAVTGRLLDRLLFPGFRRTPVAAPLFILAAPRSGTTFLHRLLSQDQDHFAHFRLVDMIFPAVVYQRLFAALARIDRRIGGLLARGLGRVERLCFGGWEDRHPMGFTRPEEDEALFALTLTSEAVYLLCPRVGALPPVAFLDQLPPAARRGTMRFYRESARRRLFAAGGDRALLAKSTGGAGRIRSLLETFPDARIVHLVRHPAETLPSHVSVFYPVWAWHSPEIARLSPETEAYAEVAVDWYRAMHEARDLLASRGALHIRYVDLVADPVATVERIYAHFGLQLGSGYRARLTAAARSAQDYTSRHTYTLAEYGLSPAWVRARLGDIIDAYGLEGTAPVAAGGRR